MQPLSQWFDKMDGRVTTLAPVAVQSQVLIEQLGEQKVDFVISYQVNFSLFRTVG